MTARQSRQLLGELGGDLLDGDVVLEVAVVLGEALVDVDCQAQGIGDRLRGLDGPSLRTADQPGYREPRQRVGQTLWACSRPSSDRCGIGTLPRFAAERQRVPDE